LELSYKLTMRCAKAMSSCGVSGELAKRILKAGYSIRSTFAHGSHLDNKARSKYATQFGSLEALANSLADYLRISICSYIILSLKKEDIMNLLDSAMLSADSQASLESLFAPVHQYIVI